MLRLKKGVTFNGVQPECIMGMLITQRVCEDHGYVDMITSICDGEHMAGSLHYAGLAFDRRTWTSETSGIQQPYLVKEKIADLFKQALGEYWDVVIEGTHIHCECNIPSD